MPDITTHYRSRPAVCAFPWILIVQRAHKSQIGFVAQSKPVPRSIEQCPNVLRSHNRCGCLFDPSIEVSVKFSTICRREELAVEVGEGISEGFWAFIDVFRVYLNLWITRHQRTRGRPEDMTYIILTQPILQRIYRCSQEVHIASLTPELENCFIPQAQFRRWNNGNLVVSLDTLCEEDKVRRCHKAREFGIGWHRKVSFERYMILAST